MCEALACNGEAVALLLAWLLDVMVRLLVRFFVCAVRFFVVRTNRVLRVCLLVLQKNRRVARHIQIKRRGLRFFMHRITILVRK